MRLEELRSRVEAGEIDTVLIALCDMQGRLQGKRLTARHFVEEVVDHGAEGCNYLLAVDVDMNTVDGYAMSSWERGYGDFVLKPDMDTLRLVPWQEATAMVLCDLAWEDGSDVAASPRQILRRQLARLAERGWSANAGTELEFMVFRETYESAWHKAYRNLDPANLYNVDYSMLGTARIEPLIRRIRNAMEGAGMAVENSKGECNFGQHEINFHYADALRTADDHAIYKNAAKEIAARRAWPSATWPSSTSARAARATSTSRWPTPTAATRSRGTARCSSPSWPASSPACASSRCCWRPTSTPTSASWRGRSPQRRWPGARTTAPARCAWWATARGSASSCAPAARTSTRTWRSAR